MEGVSSHELELTPDLIDYATSVALHEARKRCPKHVDYGDVVQEVLLHLVSRPPKYDPSRGASAKTLIHTIVHRGVLKYVARQCRHADRFKQAGKPRADTGNDDEQLRSLSDVVDHRSTGSTPETSVIDDMLRFVENEENRELCRILIECDCNISETARRLGVVEGTVRYRLTKLGPKLIAAGFDPFKREESL